MIANVIQKPKVRYARYDVWARIKDGSSVLLAPNCSASDIMMHIREFAGDVESFTLVIIPPTKSK